MIAEQIDDDAAITSFANHVLYDWHNAMDEFFRAVEKKAAARGVTFEGIRASLGRGYGEDVLDNYDDWSADQ